MGLDVYPAGRAKPGHEAEWAARIQLLYDRIEETKEAAELRFAVSIQPWADIGAPRVGYDAEADAWALANWSREDVWKYIRDHKIPYNPLHDQGYPSIGCMPCTTRPGADGDPRAGRWAGTDRTECGLNG